MTFGAMYANTEQHQISLMHFFFYPDYVWIESNYAFMCHWYCEMSYRRNKVRRKYYRYRYFIFSVSVFHPVFMSSIFFFFLLPTKVLQSGVSIDWRASSFFMAECIERNGIDTSSLHAKSNGDLETCCWLRNESSYKDIPAEYRYSVLSSMIFFFVCSWNALIFPYCKWILQACLSRFAYLKRNSNELWIFVVIKMCIPYSIYDAAAAAAYRNL